METKKFFVQMGKVLFQHFRLNALQYFNFLEALLRKDYSHAYYCFKCILLQACINATSGKIPILKKGKDHANRYTNKNSPAKKVNEKDSKNEESDL